MGDLLAQGSAWLEAQRTAHLTQPVVYQRGTLTVQVAASIGKTVFQVDNASGFLERIESRDYLVLASELVLAGQQALPQRGDRIREAAGGSELVYEVMAPGSEPCWRYSDPYRQTLRIHTKLIGVE